MQSGRLGLRYGWDWLLLQAVQSLLTDDLLMDHTYVPELFSVYKFIDVLYNL